MDDNVKAAALFDSDGLIVAAAAAAIAALLDAATAAAASVSSNGTVCAVTRDGNPAPFVMTPETKTQMNESQHIHI
jgi:hypothetical protein